LKDTLAQIFGQKILQSIIHIDDDNDQNQEFKVNKNNHIFEKVLSSRFSSMVIYLDLNMVPVVPPVIDNISM
jgi:hypothetical protein